MNRSFIRMDLWIRKKNLIYIACENSQEHFLLKIPINEIEG